MSANGPDSPESTPPKYNTLNPFDWSLFKLTNKDFFEDQEAHKALIEKVFRIESAVILFALPIIAAELTWYLCCRDIGFVHYEELLWLTDWLFDSLRCEISTNRNLDGYLTPQKHAQWLADSLLVISLDIVIFVFLTPWFVQGFVACVRIPMATQVAVEMTKEEDRPIGYSFNRYREFGRRHYYSILLLCILIPLSIGFVWLLQHVWCNRVWFGSTMSWGFSQGAFLKVIMLNASVLMVIEAVGLSLGYGLLCYRRIFNKPLF